MHISKPNHGAFHPSRGNRTSRGFALIVTLTMMILLTIVAVAMLSLSSIALRSSDRGKSMSIARSNARLALMLALGDLQKSAGPDQRITARADIIDPSIANPKLTGVWSSREVRGDSLPTPADFSKSATDQKFIGWLASARTPSAAANVDFAASQPLDPVTLWGKGSMGNLSSSSSMVRASRLGLTSNRGSIAWAVMDEGVKARMNTSYSSEAGDIASRSLQLGSGRAPNPALIDGLSGFKREFLDASSTEYEEISKGITAQNLALASERLSQGTRETLKSLGHDVTAVSAGLFTDTAGGGLREDLHLLANRESLPSTYTNGGIYMTRLGLTSSDAASEPRWEAVHEYSRLYKEKVSMSGGTPQLQARVPQGWVAAVGSNPTSGIPGVIQKSAPKGMVLMPTIAKVEVVFSLLARDIYKYNGGAGAVIPENSPQLHGPWGDNFRGSSYDYLLHLLYTPVVTLHNPYNVALEFNDLKVVFSNVPFALQVWRNGEAQTTGLAPLDQMYHQTSELGKVNKRFGMTLKTKTTVNTPGVAKFRLLPGEVKMFSPYIPPHRSWSQECTSERLFWDYDNDANRTLNIEGIPGWRGDGIGFDLDWFCPQPLRHIYQEVENGKSMDRGGCIGMRRVDEFHVLFAPLSVPNLSNNKFVVEMFASSGGTPVSSGIIEMDYESPTGLQDFLLGKDGTIRYPASGTVNTMEMLDHSSTAIRKYAKVKPFAILSARAKTTAGGMGAYSEDGELATKPWAFAHANIAAISQKIVSEHPANHSHELDLQILENGTLNLMQVGNQDRGNFITGNTADSGVKFGSIYDIPLAPIQTLSGLNGANLGGSSAYLPRFAQPVGNSWAHPLMSPDKLIEPQVGSTYLDHSFLLNSALFDHYYFSGFADQGGPLGKEKSAQTLAEEFAKGNGIDDPRFKMHIPGGQTSGAFADLVSQDKDAYTKVAAWQMMEGAFNINSTSVAAWKAMLGSVRDTQAIVNLINPDDGSIQIGDLPATKSDESRISRFRVPSSESEQDGADARAAYWMGPREYSSDDIQTLAEKIVEQVRLRGPFLSLSEFVNRRLGSESDDLAQRGALQQAIDDSRLNESIANDAAAGFEITAAQVASYKYKNAKAGTGPSYQGAPGYLTQADLLAVLGNAATARSDTFTIRAYGDAKDAAGKIIASATCEAVVQRTPDYVDPADRADIHPTALTSPANRNFGRKFQIVFFRWLAHSEI